MIPSVIFTAFKSLKKPANSCPFQQHPNCTSFTIMWGSSFNKQGSHWVFLVNNPPNQLHHDFEGQWNGRFKRDMSHPDYQSQLLNCVVEYNSKHI